MDGSRRAGRFQCTPIFDDGQKAGSLSVSNACQVTIRLRAPPKGAELSDGAFVSDRSGAARAVFRRHVGYRRVPEGGNPTSSRHE